MSVRLLNPYRGKDGQWVRANLHGHCRESSGCAAVTLSEGVQQYHRIGTQILAVTDHDVVTDLAAVGAAYPDMVFLEGFEHSEGKNLLFIGPEVAPLYERPLDEAMALADGLLTIVCHPQPEEGREYWSLEKIVALGRLPDGIEVYNGHYGIERMLARGRTPLYTRFWDEMLTAGHRVWGFANDDFHDLGDFDNAYNMVLVEERSAAAALRAAKSGCFYATTGLALADLAETDGNIEVELVAPSTGRFVGPGGTILAEAQDVRFGYTVTSEAYVRFEAENESGRLFLQPMFRED